MDTETPKDFFISYTLADQRWAEWIAWHLEAEGYQTRIQAWDFLAGSNFILEMDAAARQATRTIAVLSPDYFTSQSSEHPSLYSKLRTSPLDTGLEQVYSCSRKLLNVPGKVQSLHPA